MRRSKILGTGFYVPEQIRTNDDLAKMFDTSDEWIYERSGIKERRVAPNGMGVAEMSKYATEKALEDAGLTTKDIDMIVLATLSPDFCFPGSGCVLQSKMDFGTIPAIDVRQQCSGFIYAVSIADQFIKTGAYDNILVIGGENHTGGLEYNNRGRAVTVLFGDGAGAVIMGPAEKEDEGLLGFTINADGKYYDKLWTPAPRSDQFPRISYEMIDDGSVYPIMDGKYVFKHAINRFPEAMNAVLDQCGYTMDDVDLFIPHQANERITRFVQAKVGLPDEKVVSNIHKYANTTAATIPICICEAREEGRLKPGDLLLVASFGAGFTWGSLLFRWTI